jgi:hypothetical protein
MATVKLVRRLANPARKVRRRRATTKRINPALVVTLGAANPTRRRKNTMAKRRRKVNARRRSRRSSLISFIAPVTSRRRNRRRRRNPVVVRTVRRRRYGRRRNPLFPGVTVTQVLGGLLGVAATRFVGQMIPSQLTGFAGSAGPFVKDLVAGAIVAWGGSKIAEGGQASQTKGDLAKGVSFGALMQVASTGVQTFIPALRTYGIGISGMGYMMPAQFPVPQNPLAIPAPPPAANGGRVTQSGLARAFGQAF